MEPLEPVTAPPKEPLWRAPPNSFAMQMTASGRFRGKFANAKSPVRKPALFTKGETEVIENFVSKAENHSRHSCTSRRVLDTASVSRSDRPFLRIERRPGSLNDLNFRALPKDLEKHGGLLAHFALEADRGAHRRSPGPRSIGHADATLPRGESRQNEGWGRHRHPPISSVTPLLGST